MNNTEADVKLILSQAIITLRKCAAIIDPAAEVNPNNSADNLEWVLHVLKTHGLANTKTAPWLILGT